MAILSFSVLNTDAALLSPVLLHFSGKELILSKVYL